MVDCRVRSNARQSLASNPRAAAVSLGAAVRERAMEEEWGGLGKDLTNRKRGEPVEKAQSLSRGLRKSACGGWL